MSDDATIEDEPEYEHPTHSNRPETSTGLLKWSYILEIATKQWFFFLVFSIAVAIFLYRSRQRKHKSVGAALRGEYVPGASKEKARSTSSKRD